MHFHFIWNPAELSLSLSFFLSVCLSVRLSVCLSVCQSLSLTYTDTHFLAHTLRSIFQTPKKQTTVNLLKCIFIHRQKLEFNQNILKVLIPKLNINVNQM